MYNANEHSLSCRMVGEIGITDEKESTEKKTIAEERRGQILTAALKCFAKRGFHQTSMAEVCAEAKLSPGSVYRYFRSKEEIITALAEAEHQLLASWYSELTQKTSVRDALDTLIGYWLDSAEDHGDYDGPDFCVVYVELCAEAARNPHIAAIAEKFDAAQLAVIEMVLQQAVDRGEIAASLDRNMTARLINATLDGVMIRLAYDKSLSSDAYRNTLRTFLYGAIGSAP
ncbi:MAG: TetR/AcrR family transcriptional regulator [Akkermansiaceae bacterium]|nr:TetR/AcrR family transcriptional regulator [Armatimonadota bacterium]